MWQIVELSQIDVTLLRKDPAQAIVLFVNQIISD